ncbi:MAG TPA: HXXEE domain-containing protein [Mycobacterium sp.]|nr:HXXEE domain-containing protein [Mycobacterium sp.]HTX96283.1 HXXEE domain-containing protein [Mycobacterium sp.]
MTSAAPLDTYRTHWPRVGAVLGMAVGGAATLAARKQLTNLRALSVINFIALLVHQYEEYEDPGYFPGQFNRGIFKGDQPRNYPLNTNTAMCINTAVAYPFYIAPILFPRAKWLGLPPVLFGISQSVGHGVVFPRIANARYSPGFLASILLHVPIGFAYIRALRRRGPVGRSTWLRSLAVTVIFAVLGVAGPNFLGRDRNSPYAFTAKQMGNYDTIATALTNP